MKTNKPILTNSTVIRKEYSYNLGNVSLRFTLRTDNTDELIPYLELMKHAIVEIEKDIKEIISKRKK